MESLQGKLERQLQEALLTTAEIKTIVEIVKSKLPAAYRWSDPVDGYPEPVWDAAWLATRTYAERWLKEHAPGHMARVVFADDQDAMMAEVMAAITAQADADEAVEAAFDAAENDGDYDERNPEPADEDFRD